ncbi:hypothetical protein BU23DRAFT_595191 [Bimuria novae-zelandiae CBS 107.79]|uniref:Uncharacterized protein n=1 Tax=Bimuria novae-zelandiae CBS 107.79 TaxID=1447943 RepID=A0A6A5VWJ7_9PLEO|nr:hypothetical protein BU23DRAFT_595191 [Bimuria novae-zelandiae CBS 107.79]
MASSWDVGADNPLGDSRRWSEDEQQASDPDEQALEAAKVLNGLGVTQPSPPPERVPIQEQVIQIPSSPPLFDVSDEEQSEQEEEGDEDSQKETQLDNQEPECLEQQETEEAEEPIELPARKTRAGRPVKAKERFEPTMLIDILANLLAPEDPGKPPQARQYGHELVSRRTASDVHNTSSTPFSDFFESIIQPPVQEACDHLYGEDFDHDIHLWRCYVTIFKRVGAQKEVIVCPKQDLSIKTSLEDFQPTWNIVKRLIKLHHSIGAVIRVLSVWHFSVFEQGPPHGDLIEDPSALEEPTPNVPPASQQRQPTTPACSGGRGGTRASRSGSATPRAAPTHPGATPRPRNEPVVDEEIASRQDLLDQLANHRLKCNGQHRCPQDMQPNLARSPFFTSSLNGPTMQPQRSYKRGNSASIPTSPIMLDDLRNFINFVINRHPRFTEELNTVYD